MISYNQANFKFVTLSPLKWTNLISLTLDFARKKMPCVLYEAPYLSSSDKEFEIYTTCPSDDPIFKILKKIALKVINDFASDAKPPLGHASMLVNEISMSPIIESLVQDFKKFVRHGLVTNPYENESQSLKQLMEIVQHNLELYDNKAERIDQSFYKKFDQFLKSKLD
jgi:hypothetical protein